MSKTRPGKSDSQVIEEPLQRDPGLDDVAEIWPKVSPAAEEEGMVLATDKLRALRKEKRGQGGTRPGVLVSALIDQRQVSFNGSGVPAA